MTKDLTKKCGSFNSEYCRYEGRERMQRKLILMVFRVTRKLMIWYLEQHENSCLVFRATRQQMVKVIRATRKSMPLFQGPIFWKLGI